MQGGDQEEEAAADEDNDCTPAGRALTKPKDKAKRVAIL
jgi:hypothetical protein